MLIDIFERSKMAVVSFVACPSPNIKMPMPNMTAFLFITDLYKEKEYLLHRGLASNWVAQYINSNQCYHGLLQLHLKLHHH